MNIFLCINNFVMHYTYRLCRKCVLPAAVTAVLVSQELNWCNLEASFVPSRSRSRGRSSVWAAADGPQTGSLPFQTVSGSPLETDIALETSTSSRSKQSNEKETIYILQYLKGQYNAKLDLGIFSLISIQRFRIKISKHYWCICNCKLNAFMSCIKQCVSKYI